MWLTDPKTKEPSVTLTVFVTGALTVTLKLLVSGLTVGSVSMSPFSGVEYAAAIAALGGIYTLRRNVKIGKD